MNRAEAPSRVLTSPLRWVLPVLALAVSLGLSYGAYRLASYSWDQVVSYKSPYATLAAPPAASAVTDDEKPQRVVMVLIDGLRDDASRTMASISGLRARGADVRLTLTQPSLSYPSWTAAVTGATQQISGVTTNWFEGPVTVQTLFDVVHDSGRSMVIAGTTDLDTMFRASELTTATALIDWNEEGYTSDAIVDDALALDRGVGGADFVFVLLPDVDIAGHDFGGTSPEYAAVVAKVDADLGRLIEGLDDGNTTFVVLPDHGHIDTGGHGGWEAPVVRTFAAFAGPGVTRASAEAHLADVAPTVAVLAGLPAPAEAVGTAIDEVLADRGSMAKVAEDARALAFTAAYVRQVTSRGAELPTGTFTRAQLEQLRREADAERLAGERRSRLAIILGTAVAALVFVLVLAVTSWRALVAALAGTDVYFAAYNALFFGLHHLNWSLSAFNEETLIDAFFNQRMLEAALSGLAACLVAALVYGALTRRQRVGGVAWLSLGGAVVVAIQVALVLQVAAFLWRWGAQVTWILPDMREAFKYDLDLIQMTALGAAAVIGPLLAWVAGRLHRGPKAAGA